MSFIRTLTGERSARKAALFMKCVCYFIIAFSALCLVLSLMGRQSFTLHSKQGIFENAICAEDNHAGNSRSMTVSTADTVRVWTDGDDRIEPLTRAGLSVIFALHTLPRLLAIWLLSRVFSGIQAGQIFTAKNAGYLLWYGLIQLFTAVPLPFIKLFVCWLITTLSGNRVEISTGQNMAGLLVQSIAFLVAAYIIHYGITLQDEVDHTL